jgi:quercetin dioxygenase-like cupin family protein
MVRITNMPEVKKPWGGERLVAHTGRYALKDIFLRAGTRSSLQSHARKLETILVLEGELELEVWDAEDRPLRERYRSGEAYTIEPGTRHRVAAITDVRVVEASSPELDDVIRHADDFGRAGA